MIILGVIIASWLAGIGLGVYLLVLAFMAWIDELEGV